MSSEKQKNEQPRAKKRKSRRQGVFLTRIDPRILIPSILIVTWSISYDFFIYEISDIYTLIFGQLNSITGILADGFILITLGLILVGFYAVTDSYFLFITDIYGFAKLEQSWNESVRNKGERDYRRFVSSIINLDKQVQPSSPIPKSINSITILFVAYYVVNLIEILLLTEIMYLTTAEVFKGIIKLDPISENYLTIFSAAILMGARGAAFLRYDKAQTYGTMVVETIFVFVLIGIIAMLFESDLQTFIGLITEREALGRFLANALKLAMIPLVIELAFWVITLYRTSGKEK